MSELWGGGVPTSDSDPSTPRLRRQCYKLYIYPSCPTWFYCFSGLFLSLLHPNPYHHQQFIVESLSLFVHTFHVFSFREAPPTWTSPAPATRQPPQLVYAPCSACLRLSPFPVTARPPSPPFDTLGLHPVPCHPLVGLSVANPSVSPVPLPRPPWVLLWILASSGSWFFVGWILAWGRDSRAPPLPGSWSPWTSPPLLLDHSSAFQDTPHPYPLSPPPLLLLWL